MLSFISNTFYYVEKYLEIKFHKRLTQTLFIEQCIIGKSDDNTEFEVIFSQLEIDYKANNSYQNEVFKYLITLGLNDEIENEQKVVDKVKKVYYDILGTHKKLFPYSDNLVNKGGTCSNIRENSLTQKIQPQVKLSQIDLPNFDGNVKDWPHFKDMFQSLIHDNALLSEIEKFYYLMSCLKSEPLAFSKTLPLTGQNYPIIWNQLNEHYENKRILALCYLEEIINAPCLNNESSKKLRPFLDLLTDNLIALKAMN